jgi:hypothetical protein
VGEAGSAVVCVFAVVVHLELAAGHLGDAVVDGLAGVYGRLQVGVLQRQQGARSLGTLITRPVVDEDAKVDGGGD